MSSGAVGEFFGWEWTMTIFAIIFLMLIIPVLGVKLYDVRKNRTEMGKKAERKRLLGAYTSDPELEDSD